MMRRTLALAAFAVSSCNSRITFDGGSRSESGGSSGSDRVDAGGITAGAGGATHRDAGRSSSPGTPPSTGGQRPTDDTHPGGQGGRLIDDHDASPAGGKSIGDAGSGLCGSATDCPPGNTCDPTGHCIETCLNGLPCPMDTPHCDARGVCVRCTQNVDCAASTTGHVCNPANGECVECVSGSQCAHTLPRCDPATNTCVRCMSNADCSSQHEWPICSSSGACIDT